jgi:hypothetical protein
MSEKIHIDYSDATPSQITAPNRDDRTSTRRSRAGLATGAAVLAAAAFLSGCSANLSGSSSNQPSAKCGKLAPPRPLAGALTKVYGHEALPVAIDTNSEPAVCLTESNGNVVPVAPGTALDLLFVKEGDAGVLVPSLNPDQGGTTGSVQLSAAFLQEIIKGTEPFNLLPHTLTPFPTQSPPAVA